MGKREQARIEAAFMRGDAGVDGGATEEDTRDEAEIERDKAREQLLRGRAYLGREFLTWLLWRSEAGNVLVDFEGTGVVVLYTGRCTLRGVNGDVTELMARGALAPYSEQVKHAMDRGLLVHQARWRLTHGEKVYEVTLDAEFLDIRAAKLPELMAEEEDDRLLERLYLTEQLSGMVDALVQSFLEVRASRNWSKKVVPAMKSWMKGEDEAPRATKVKLARAARG
ncbi:hypothetical protein KYC5002_35710 [Archangium violaceum]|uniref:hypothetical protein n=1 Tax=Archangium violaceum TaxID=83451 RepID=UPI002B2C1B8B|nr:hypothetical protein KYC5002_35710 [Archangium gephyra]